jgi:hypothetical protein
VIAPSLDTAALIARLEIAPVRLRTALALVLDRAIRDRLGPRRSLSIDPTADTVTATIRTAGVPPASARVSAQHYLPPRTPWTR